MPHVLLALVDALRTDHLGCYAGKDAGTPEVDELARQGVVFENAISQASWTRPSTASIMTGLYPSQNGLGTQWSETGEGKLSARSLNPSIPTLAEMLTAGGHATAFMGGNANLKPLFGITRGFAHHLCRSTNDGAVIAEDFERWLRTERPESSFCYLHFMDVHNPLPQDTISTRLDTGVDLDLVNESKNALMSYYAAAVRRVDGHIGRVVRALEEAGTLEDTLIIFSADHGEELGEHGGMLSHGRTLYRELVHVPLIVRLPGGAFVRERIDQPVESIDFVPTVLDYLGCPPADVPGRSLLPLIRGEETEERAAAFSERIKPDWYSQSVTTRTHQFIQNYLLEEATPSGSPADLRPGLTVSVKGQRLQGKRLMPTKVLIQGDGLPALTGPVERVDAASGSITLMGVACQIDEDTEFVEGDSKPSSLDGLAVGDRVTLNFDAESNGRRVATMANKRPPGGKSMIKGRIERVRDLEGGVRSITVLGTDILIDGSTKVKPMTNGKRGARVNPVNRVLAGEFIDVHRELYDITSDPAETRNIVDERPDIAQELEEMLARWTESLLGRVRTTTGGGSVDIDPETMEQLRRMGYIE